jgi:general secretion pathway protein K
MRTHPSRSGRRGVALFAALWLVVAIGVVGLQFSLEARERRLAAANSVELLESRAAANAGIDHAQARLDRLARQPRLSGQGAASLRSQDPWLGVDTIVNIDGEVGGARYEVRVRDVTSALNPNRANEEQLRMLFTRLGFDYGLADQLAQSIVDWRDEDIMHRSRGAEREQYVAEDRMILPRDGPLQDLSELLHVMHMTPEIYDSIAPFLILDGNNARINVNTAPPEVIATLPGMSDAGLAGLMRARESGRRITSTADLRSVTGGSGPTIPANRVTFDVSSLAVTSTGWNRGGRTPVRVVAIIDRITNQATPAARVQSRTIR